MTESFSHEFRIVDSASFAKVFKDCKKSNNHSITILSGFDLGKNPRLGLIVAKKQIRKATDRNYIKRLIRESFRKKQLQLPCYDFIVIARKSILGLTGKEILQALEKLWDHQIQLRQINGSTQHS